MNTNNDNIFNRVFGDFFEFSWDVFKFLYVGWMLLLTATVYVVTFVSVPVWHMSATELTFWENLCRIAYGVLQFGWWTYFAAVFGGALFLALLTYNLLFNMATGVFK